VTSRTLERLSGKGWLPVRPIQSLNNRNAIGVGAILGAGAILFVAVFLGYVAAVMPWFISLGLVLLPILFVLVLTKPYVALLLTLAMLFEAVPSAFQPRLPFGGGNLRLYDLLILLLLLVVILRQVLARKSLLVDLGPMLPALGYFTFAFGVSLFYGKFIVHNAEWLTEGRSAITWALLPLIVMACDTPKRFHNFVIGTVVLGLIIALYVSVQSLFEIRIMTEARVEALDVGVNSDVTRSIADGGIYIVIFSVYLILNRLADNRLSWLLGAPLLSLLMIGVAVQFGRGIWVAGALGLVMSTYLHRGFGGLLRVVILGVVGLTLLLGALSIVKPRMVEALLDRATGISREIQSGGSFDWRKRENSAAFTAIERHPFLGVGIGGDYKQTISSKGSFGIETRYIHNGYLYFPLKMGLYAAFIPLVFILCFVRVFRLGLRRHGREGDMGLRAALAGGFFVPVITSFTQPEWVAPRGVAAFCVFMAIALLYLRDGKAVVQHKAHHAQA